MLRLSCRRFSVTDFKSRNLVSDGVTLGAIPEPDMGPGEPGEDPAVTAAHKKLEEMQLTDDPDSIPIIPSSHEKADMLMAYSTVPGMYPSYQVQIYRLKFF